MNDDTELVRLLLDRGADIHSVTADVPDRVKNGPIDGGRLGVLHLAATYGRPETLRLLIKAGADTNAVETGTSFTPLMCAVTSDRPNVETVRLLLANGANPLKNSSAGKSAIDWAKSFRNPEILEALGASRSGEPVSSELKAEPEEKNPREAVERSLRLLQRASVNFLPRGGYISCHAQTVTGMAVSVAHSQGFAVDRDLDTALTNQTKALTQGPEQLFLQLVDPQTGLDGTMYSLLQLSAAGVPPSPSIDAMIRYLAAAQRRDGSWLYRPVARPPIEDGPFFTALGLRCLQLYTAPALKEEFEQRVRRAAKWLADAEPQSTQDRAMQILGLHWAGREMPVQRLQELLALQHSDGGWAQTPYLRSYAYGTGSFSTQPWLWRTRSRHRAKLPSNRRLPSPRKRTTRTTGALHKPINR